jgi:hypothetical protein
VRKPGLVTKRATGVSAFPFIKFPFLGKGLAAIRDFQGRGIALHRSLDWLGLSVAAAAAVVTVSGPVVAQVVDVSAPAVAKPVSGGAFVFGEIVVTARKRDESIQTVPKTPSTSPFAGFVIFPAMVFSSIPRRLSMSMAFTMRAPRV